MGIKELRWMSQHQKEIEKHSGMWIAVWEDRIISVGRTAKEVLEESQKKGVKTPHVTIVPRRDEGTYVL